MTGRALVFSNPEVIRRLQNAFVPYAGDKWYLNRQSDGDGKFFRDMARQREGDDQNGDGTGPQGLYVALPDGTLLAYDHFHPSPERLLALLKQAEIQAKKTPLQSAAVVTAAATAADPQFVRQPPQGGLVLNVFSRIPLPPPPGQAWNPNQATGRDHLWVTRDEWRALLPATWKNGMRYPVPRALAERIVRFHLVDNVRGEPPFWDKNDIRQMELHLRVEDAAAGRLRLDGTARLASGKERGYDARVQGYITYNRAVDRITRFDLLSWGDAWGEGAYTRNAPPGKFPLLIAASLAGKSAADRVPPQASRNLAAYLGDK